jgi:hypothetical protein
MSDSKSSDILSDGPVKDILKPGDKQVGLYSGGGLIFGMRWVLVHVVGLYTGGGGGLQYLVTILYIVVLYYIYELVDKK